jgi:hypothetical protein
LLKFIYFWEDNAIMRRYIVVSGGWDQEVEVGLLCGV